MFLAAGPRTRSVYPANCVHPLFLAAGLSEDSDYTSDINYPLQHQHNTSMHQFREHPFRPAPFRDNSEDSRDYYPGNEYADGSFERDASFEEYGDRGYDRERDYYAYHANVSMSHASSLGAPLVSQDSEWDPLSYVSQPNRHRGVYLADRWVRMTNSTTANISVSLFRVSVNFFFFDDFRKWMEMC